MKSTLIFVLCLLVSPLAFAEAGEFFLDPHVSVGFNSAQGTHFTLGLSGGMRLDENLSVGMGAYYSAGEHPQHDREIGVGPFVSYVEPFTSFLVGQLRQEINYLDMYNPVRSVDPVTGEEEYSHTSEKGVASVTSAALYVYFTRALVVSAGYRFVLGLSNEALDDGRSGAFFGVAIGI